MAALARQRYKTQREVFKKQTYIKGRKLRTRYERKRTEKIEMGTGENGGK
tara:strand:- start:217 stop:366 length:150 start_codon:yes stop_codon:yes gene_type:complete